MTIAIWSSGAETAMERALAEQLPKFDPAQSRTSSAPETNPVIAPGVKVAPSTRARRKLKSQVVLTNAITLPEVKISVAPITESTASLPRAETPRVQEELKIDSFASPAERDRLLLKRHLSPLDRQVLNRFKIPLIGQTNIERAHDAEDIYQTSLSLGRIADQIELPKSPEENAAEAKRTKEMYYQLFYARPR